MSDINYACSLGSLCHSSQLLKRNKYKLSSYPFDWIFSNENNIIHCIKDDFKIFLDKSYYINVSQSICGHSYYDKNMFNHFNPLMNIEHYNYYVRCVDRFKDLLKKSEHKLFIMIFVNRESTSNADNADILKQNIIEFNNEFSKYTSNYTLLVIIHHPNKSQNHHKFTYNDNIHFLDLDTLSISGGVQFKNNNDNIYLDNILNSHYKFNVKRDAMQTGNQQEMQKRRRNQKEMQKRRRIQKEMQKRRRIQQEMQKRRIQKVIMYY